MRTSSNLIARLGGLAAAMGGALWAAKAFYDRNDAPPWPTDATDTLFLVVPLLFLVGLVGLYARCRGRLREWETISSVASAVAVVGLLGSAFGYLSTVLEVGPAWRPEISWWVYFFGFFLMNLGLVFLGNSILQTGLLSRLSVLPLLTGALGILLVPLGEASSSLPAFFYPTLTLWVLYGLGWIALGCVLYSGEGGAVRQPATAR
ncbi:MAG: hypothetical protein M3151_05675 [Actinomycetota bacterium]|nr:hypothetical protein [Actinomycetota bacterium]